ncbi:uncharacterized protein LOC117326402 isoform X2 [Pecten maximus]|uniref:uncharacterized protein LOC117326402 isoform X2 n=1 Tax=Pecten maximus TaxID=6579 RepID=UPI0014580106|nr:uncharacterized protein LOC117326402 isoform X2 [Pecten maximus]
MDTECVVLYTHQKQKKAKTWHDGVLKILTPGTRAILYDDKKTKIDTIHIKPEAIVSGEQLESDRYLILIEEIKSGVDHGQIQDPCGQASFREQPVVQVHPKVPKVPTASVGTGARLSIRAGIKRRKTGFVPPRMIKQPRLDVDEGQTDSGERNPDAVDILSLYSRMGAAKPSDSIHESESVSTYSSGLKANTGPSFGSPIDQRASTKNDSPLLDRLTCDESPGILSLRSSPWSSFGAGRLGRKGDSPRNAEGGSNRQLLNGTKSNHQNVTSKIYSRTTNFSDRNMQKDQTSYDKKGSGFASYACAVIDNKQKISSKILISDTNTGPNTAIKRSASQIMALLVKSRDKEPIQAADGIQNKHTSQDSSALSMCLSSSSECHTDKTCYPEPHVHKTAATNIHQSASGIQFSVQNNPASVNYHKEIQDEADVKTSCNGKMQDSCSDFDFSLTGPSESRDKHQQSDNHSGSKTQLIPEDFIANTKFKQCNSEGDVWAKQREKNQDIKSTYQEDILPSQDSINVKACHKSDLFTQEKTEEGSVSKQEIEQHDFESSFQDICSNEEMRDESIDKQLTAEYDCSRKDRPDSSDDDLEVDNIDVAQQGSFLISFSPLSEVSNSDDESNIHSSNSTDVYQKQNIKQDQEGENSLSQQDQDQGLVENSNQSQKDQGLVENRSQQDQCLVENRSQQDQGLVENQLQQDQSLEDFWSQQEQDLEGSRSQHEQNLDGCQSQHEQALEGCLSQHEQSLKSCQSQHEQALEGSQSQHEQALEGSRSLQEQSSKSCQFQQEQASGACWSKQGQVVEMKNEWTNKPENSGEIDSLGTNIQLTGSYEESSKEMLDCHNEGKAKWSDKAENPGKSDSSTPYIQLTGSSGKNSLEIRHCQTFKVNASRSPKTEECAHSPDVLNVHSVTSEHVNSLNDLHFSPDSVTFSSLSSAEGRLESSELDVSSWQTKQTVISPHSSNQEFPKIIVSCPETTSKNIVQHSDVMRDITNIIPETNAKHQCKDELKPVRSETSPHDCTPCDVSESQLESLLKPDSLPSSELSLLRESSESVSQTESVNNEFGRNTSSPGLNHNCVENTSPSLVRHLSENSWGKIVPGSGMIHHYDTNVVRTTQEQLSFTEPMQSTQYRKHSAVMEKFNMTEEPLPHPSKLLRRSSVMSKTTAAYVSSTDQEDPFVDRAEPGPIENATQRLQQYKVRGSVSGGMARRTSVSGLDYSDMRSPSLSVTEDLRTNFSPSQTLENTRFLTDQDDHSLFIDWNVGKPKLVDINTLFNAQDIKIPDSPYQHVPTASESPCSYKGVCDDSVNVPDIDINRTTQIGSRHQATVEDFTSHHLSDESGPSVFTPGCGLRDDPSKSNRIPFEAESPTYGNMFKEKRNMMNCDSDFKVSTFCNHLDKHAVEKTGREKTSLKCKPFQDLYTHTSYTSKYFSPSKKELRVQKDIPANEDMRDLKNIPTSVDSETQNDTPASIDSEFQTDDTKYIKQPYLDSQLDILDEEYTENNSNGEQLIRDKCSLDKNADLHLSLSSVGSSDLELSFTLTDYHRGQSKPHIGLPQEDPLYSLESGDNGDLRPRNKTDFKLTTTCEDKVPSGAEGGNGSKWGKFIMDEDQDDELIFDGSFDEQFNSRKLEDRVCFRSVSQKLPSVNDPCKKISENSGQLSYNKFVSNTSNYQKSEKLASTVQKPYIPLQDTQQQTMSPLVTDCMLNRVIPDDTKVSSTEEIICQGVLMDDFDLDMEDMTDCSSLSQQIHAKPDLHIAPLSSTALTNVNKLDVIPSRSKHVITEKTATTTSKHVSASSQEATNCEGLSRQNTMKKFRSPLPSLGLVAHVLKVSKRNLSGELQFASKEEVDSNPVPLRELSITVNFPNVAVYKQVLIAVLREHLNIILFGLAQRYHHTLAMADISNYIPSQPSGPLGNKSASMNQASTNPSCQCGVPSKMIQVKKAGNNKGRFFFACNAARNKQCKYFQWVDQSGGMRTSASGANKLKLCEASSINTYMRGNHLMLYCECELIKKADFTSHFKQGVPNWVKKKYGQTNQDKKKLYIKLSKKDTSSLYSKDDLWIISTTLNFLPSQTFLAKSVYFGPNSANEVEIEAVAGFSPSNWSSHAFCHAVLAGNIASESCYLSNIEDNMSPMSVPILPWILDRNPSGSHRESSQHGGFKAPVRTTGSETNMFATKTSTMELAEEFIQRFNLNADQTKALIRVCNMFCGGAEGQDPVLLIHGVFGAGKSFLLSVIVLFLVRLFEVSDSYTPGVPYPWKILISSTTNVAVDRILLSLLDIGFEDFVRVGSVKKISKPVLPFSVHATGSESQELKDLQEMLRSGELTPSEKHNVRQSIEKHRLGENKKRLSKVRVVGVTCASCTAFSLDRMTFPVVLLDESSQMTEPASMLPIAKFGCEKLLLVGDPKQLDPTIQGSEAAHNNGLEQTLFDRLMKMGHTPTVLRTQYRCHPVISNLANTLFYDGRLSDGVTTSDREPLVPEVPTLCFYDVSKGQEQADDGGSFYNEKEAVFVTSLIQALLVRGVEPASIGVITLYKSQMFKINTSLLTNVQSNDCKEIKATRVSTVDAFQGGEHDIIILSCVRTNGVGFIDNHKYPCSIKD